MHPKLTGLIAAPHTPFDIKGQLNLPIVERQAEHFIKHGVTGVFVAGSTGEGSALTVAERQALAKRWMEVAGESLRVIVHVGHTCPLDAKVLAAHAGKIGANGIAALAPFYHKPASVAQLLDFLQPVAAAAPELPFYFYDIPILTNVRLPMTEFLAQGKERLPNLQGIKYTNPDLMQLQECLRYDNGAFDILFGCDEALLAALALGVDGAVGSTYNFAAPLYHEIIAAFQSSAWETARAKQAQSVQMIRIIAEYGFAAAAKTLMAAFGVDCGASRPPLRNLSNEERAELVERLRRLEVLPN